MGEREEILYSAGLACKVTQSNPTLDCKITPWQQLSWKLNVSDFFYFILVKYMYENLHTNESHLPLFMQTLYRSTRTSR